jgi:hypothetical protein
VLFRSAGRPFRPFGSRTDQPADRLLAGRQHRVEAGRCGELGNLHESSAASKSMQRSILSRRPMTRTLQCP